MSRDRMAALAEAGWCLTRDGSTATASAYWDDPDDPESGWGIHVKHTDGHGVRFTVETSGLGLCERGPADLARLSALLADAAELMRDWRGELPDD